MIRYLSWINHKLSQSNTQYSVLFVMFMICGYRAMTLSMTHDESATWLFTQEWNVLTSLFDPAAWETANNHYLNSLFLKLNNIIFGDGEFQSRMHSVLAFYMMGYWGIKLIGFLYSSNNSKSIAFIFLIFNPYLFDFFSLARGYAGAMAFLMGGIYYLYMFQEENSAKNLILSFFLISVSSLFLLTHLIFVPLFALLVWVSILKHKDEKKIKYHQIIIPVVFLTTLAIMVYTPMTTLRNNAEFAWGTGSFFVSIKETIKDTFYNFAFLGKYTFDIIGVAVLIACLIVVLNVIIRQKLKRLRLLIALFALLIAGLFASHYILGMQFPINRKALIYLPFFSLIIPGLFEGKHHINVKTFVASTLSGFTLIVFIYNLNLNKVHEWYYDYNTKHFVHAIIEDSSKKPTSFAAHWLFHWTAKYYLLTSDIDHNIIQKPYSKELDTSNLYNYYLVEEKHLNTLDKRYKPLTAFDDYKNVVLTSN